MNISELFIKRPVMTTLVMASILIFGIMSYKKLPVSDLPNVDFPTIEVSASLSGASPETMASSVATTLEKQFSTIAGLDSMTSESTTGRTRITLQFSLERDIDAAAQDVQSAISKALPKLPPTMTTPPSYSKVNPADQPIIMIALTSSTLPLSQLNEYGENILGQRISTINGVAQVNVYGSQKYAVRIQLDPYALITKGIGINEVIQSIKGANVNLPTGTLYGIYKTFTVTANGQLTQASAYKAQVVSSKGDSQIRLEELGDVLDSVENDKSAAWYYDKEGCSRAIVLAVQKQPGVNTVKVCQKIKELLPTFKSIIPASVSFHLLYDRSQSIEESVNDVKFTLWLTLFLVVIVIFLFLRNISATLIPSLSMPMSIIGTFSVMYLLGYTLDNLSLMALTLSIGFVVDDAIVVLENIVRHIEMGEDVFSASIKGSKEVGFTIVSMTLSLSAVFIPVLFMGGIIGRLFHEFAVTIGVAVLISGFISLSLIPMLSSIFIKGNKEKKHNFLYKISEVFFSLLFKSYEITLKKALRFPVIMLFVFLLFLYGTIKLFKIIPKGFMPTEDTNQLFVQTEGIEGISFKSMVENQQKLASIFQKDENIESVMSNVGRGGINSGMMRLKLIPREDRKLTADEVAQSLRKKVSKLLDIRAFIQNPPSLRIGGRTSKSLYQYTLQSSSIEDLRKYSSILENEMKKIPQLQDVTTDLQIKNPQINLEIDRNKASSLGLTVEQIEEALYSAYGSRQISRIYAPDNDYAVILELKPQYQQDENSLSLIYVKSSYGKLIPIDTVAKIIKTVGPLSVNHSGQMPSVTISFNLKPYVSLGEAINLIDNLSAKILPDTITTTFQGTAQAFQTSMEGLGILLILSIVVIYIVLGILYESFIHPITILSALPLAGFGALVTLIIFNVELSIYAFVGIIMLVGLVKKNGIMMVDFALSAKSQENLNAKEAIIKASLIRFRPIMMTTMAAIMGTLPIAIGIGAGAELRRPLGLAVVGGLIFSQFLTLYITPAFFIFMDYIQRKFKISS